MEYNELGMVGPRIRGIREARNKSLRVIAGLSGISKSQLSQIERGERALDSIKQLVFLASALQISPADLIRLPIPAPGNGHTDSTIEKVRLTLDAIDVDNPQGTVCPVSVLQDRVRMIHHQSRACHPEKVATALPEMIQDLHTTLMTGTDRKELLGLAVYLHLAVTRHWLGAAGAPSDLRSRVVFLTRRLAREHGDATVLGMAAFGVAGLLTEGGAFDLALTELDAVPAVPTTENTVGLLCSLAVTRALLAETANRPGDVQAPMASAAEMSDRFGEVGWRDPLGFGFGPTNVAVRHVRVALEAGDPELAVRIAEEVRIERNPFPLHHVYHWVGFGRALAQVRGREQDAVRVFARAEKIHPQRVLRDPMVREALSGLLMRARREAGSGDLRGMAYRAGLAV